MIQLCPPSLRKRRGILTLSNNKTVGRHGILVEEMVAHDARQILHRNKITTILRQSLIIGILNQCKDSSIPKSYRRYLSYAKCINLQMDDT